MEHASKAPVIYPQLESRIIQIIPAIGWEAVYDPGGNSCRECVDVVCFALCEDGTIHAMRASVDGTITPAEPWYELDADLSMELEYVGRAQP